MKWLTEHIDTIIASIVGGGGIIGWIAERQKKKTDALVSMQRLYDEFVKDAANKFKAMHEEIETLKREIQEKDKRALSKYNALLKKYNALKSQLDAYKNKHK